MLENSISDDCPCILIEGPRWGDAAFYGKWLLAAAEADAIWEKADPSFKNHNLGMTAITLLSALWRGRVALMVCLTDWHVIMMVEMGFFVLTGERYQMVIPRQLSVGFKRALKLVQ